MTEIKRMTLPIELHELEQIKLDTVQDTKRFYVDDNERYPSVTTVTSLLTRDQIRLKREREIEEKANRVSSRASRRKQSSIV